MILDTIANAKQYANINPSIYRALVAIQEYSASNYSTGRVDLGEDIYLLFTTYETHSSEDALMEAHQKYLDVMYMVEGEEIIYVKPTTQLKVVTKPYDPTIEALLAEMDDETTAVRLSAGSFIVLFPQDAHAPACHANGACKVKKIIAKVRIDD